MKSGIYCHPSEFVYSIFLTSYFCIFQAQVDEMRNEMNNAKGSEERIVALQRRSKEEATRQAELLADSCKREADATQKAHELVGVVQLWIC